jgi:hypothetical protein
LRSYLNGKVAAPVKKTEMDEMGRKSWIENIKTLGRRQLKFIAR